MAGKLLNAHAYTLDLMAEITGLKGYKKLKKDHMDTYLEGLMARVESATGVIGRMGFLENEGETKDLRERVKDILDLKFKLKDIYFTAKEKAEAKKLCYAYEGEELEEHARRIGRLPVGFVHHAVDHDRRGRFADVQRGKGSLAHGRLAKSHEQDDERRQDFHGPARYRLLAIGFQLAGRWQCEPIYFRGSPDGELINREGAKTRRNIAVITLTFII